MYRLTKWQRFWKLDVPSSMIGLVWNAMMSMGGGWFFLTASEAITVSGRNYELPGMGSYVGAAIAEGSIGKVGIAVAVMVILVVGVNELFFQPLVTWSDRFRMERSESATTSHSVVLDLLRKSTCTRSRRCYLARSAGRWTGSPARSAWRSTRRRKAPSSGEPATWCSGGSSPPCWRGAPWARTPTCTDGSDGAPSPSAAGSA